MDRGSLGEALTVFTRKCADNQGRAFSRSVRIRDEVNGAQIHVTRSEVWLCPSFISPDTNLVRLASRILSCADEFDTRSEDEHERIVSELETLVFMRFRRLAALDMPRALSTLQKLEELCLDADTESS